MKYKVNDRILRAIAKKFSKPILEKRGSKDMCFIVCGPLTSYLNFLGIECELTEGEIVHEAGAWHHFWITVPDGRIIDPTADQFIKSDGKKLKNIWVEAQPKEYRRIIKEGYKDSPR